MEQEPGFKRSHRNLRRFPTCSNANLTGVSGGGWAFGRTGEHRPAFKEVKHSETGEPDSKVAPVCHQGLSEVERKRKAGKSIFRLKALQKSPMKKSTTQGNKMEPPRFVPLCPKCCNKCCGLTAARRSLVRRCSEVWRLAAERRRSWNAVVMSPCSTWQT